MNVAGIAIIRSKTDHVSTLAEVVCNIYEITD